MIRRALLTGAAAVAMIEAGARWNMRVEQKRREYLGDRLYTEIVGDAGDAIVVLPGLQGSTRYWNRAFDPWSATCRVIYADLLGFAQSPWPDVQYTLDDHLDALRHTLVALDATKNVTFVAHSFGTIIASYYAARYADDVQDLYLLGAPVYDSASEGRRKIWEMSPMAAIFSLDPILSREVCQLMCATRPLMQKAMPYLMPRLPRAVAEDSVLHSWPAIRGAIHNILLARPIAKALMHIGSKTTLVHGSRDEVTPISRMRAVASASGASLVIVDADHHGYVRAMTSGFNLSRSAQSKNRFIANNTALT